MEKKSQPWSHCTEWETEEQSLLPLCRGQGSRRESVAELRLEPKSLATQPLVLDQRQREGSQPHRVGTGSGFPSVPFTLLIHPQKGQGGRQGGAGRRQGEPLVSLAMFFPRGCPGAEVTLCILGSPSTFLSVLLEGGVQSPGECAPKFPHPLLQKGQPCPGPATSQNTRRAWQLPAFHWTSCHALSGDGSWEWLPTLPSGAGGGGHGGGGHGGRKPALASKSPLCPQETCFFACPLLG